MNLLECKTCKELSMKNHLRRPNPTPFKLCKSCEAEIDLLRSKGQVVEEGSHFKIYKHKDFFTVEVREMCQINGRFVTIAEAHDAINAYRNTPCSFEGI